MKMNTRPTQSKMILESLLRGEKLTPLDALKNFGCFRLGARIYELKKKGYNIQKELFRTEQNKKVARYYL
jgi:hypothetical protein